MTQSSVTAKIVKLLCCLVLVIPCAVIAQSTSSAKKKSDVISGQSTSGKPAAAPAKDNVATNKGQTAPAEQEADQIVAVVNKDVITQSELNIELRKAKQELTAQKIQLPPDDLLGAQVLQRLLTEKLIGQEAARLKLVVTDQNLQLATESIAERNKLTVAQLRKQVEVTGLTWSEYQNNLKKEILLDRLRQRVVESNSLVSDSEVDAFLREQTARQAGGLAPLGRPPAPGEAEAADVQQQAAAPQNQPLAIALSQILVRVPDGASKEEVAAKRKKIEDILALLKSGQSFETVAAGMSEGPEAMRGGQLGARPIEGWPDLFVNAVIKLGNGQISGIIQSGNGFHILKVLARSDTAPPQQQSAAKAGKPGKNTKDSGAAPVTSQKQASGQNAQPGRPPQGPVVIGESKGPMPVQQTKARHILIKTSPVMTDELALQRLKDIRDRLIVGKESFSDLAKRFSNDASAPQGGELGWLNPGDTVPPFERAMNQLQIGEISQPVQSQFGWHLITVDDRRTEDMADQFRRNQVRQYLYQKRSETAFEDWILQLRNQSYIDNRLEKRLKQQATE